MCGLAGIYRLDGGPADTAPLAAACERLAHRGPDEAGQWQEGPVAFGFRRLSILDLENGSQPMRSADGRFTAVFNGEIYNHPSLKKELESRGARYRTRSDTETILLLYEREGEKAFRRLEGMFAVAIWDSRERRLVLARDPLGVKPLYYHFDGRRLCFASELRALSAWLAKPGLDPAAVLDYLSFGFVHSPRTLLSRALKLHPGHLLRVDAQGLKIERFWDIPEAPPWIEGASPRLDEAVEQVERLLTDSVRAQLLSDVPVGAFLSGGVDSSLVTALMADAGGPRVQTFSIGFSGVQAGLDESRYARAVARHLGTDHHELILPSDVLKGVEELVPCLDEPIADSAILPTFLLSRFARQRVKVVLTGEGADELFAGYDRYKAAYVSERIARLPRWGRRAGAALARGLGRGKLFKGLPVPNLRAWAQASAHSGVRDLEGICRPDFLNQASKIDPLEWLKDPEAPHSLNGALAFDLRTVLCDCLLMKVDKASMRAGLEARVPYLDRRLVEYALHLPASSKIKRFKGKYLLRLIAQKYIPRSIAWRRKHGFVVPWEEWMRSPGSKVIDDVLSDSAFERWGIFDVGRLRRMLSSLRRGSDEVDAGLFFRVAVLGLWLDASA